MKRIRTILTTLLVMLVGVMTLNAQDSPVKWTFKTVKINDSIAELQFHATVQQGWHFYSQYKEANCIENPAIYTFTKDASKYKRIGKVVEPKPQTEYDEMFDCTSKFFTGNAVFKQRVQVLDNKPFTIKGTVEGQACIEGRCTPIEQKFSFDIKGFDNVTKHTVVEEEEEEVEEPAATAQAEVKAATETDGQAKDGEKEESLLKYFLGAV
ncbi:MAG: hypothetical protein MJZ46_02210, partial [Bacteroidales bacterium]|nr:hypothetical protein [Bacteroidales bacterium]